MRFLANENFPLDAIEALRAEGHDVAWIRRDAPGSTDAEVLHYARAADRILLTFDKDFGELAYHAGLSSSSGIVLFRLRAHSSSILSQRVVSAIRSRGEWAGCFTVVEHDRIRVRLLPGAGGVSPQ